ncbi:peptidoglycan DD-metalloendopeptidase family protein [Microbacterium oxydans]|uniref:M23 family metallopeptidase n=1 Tax=Microbacterium oxydans TaxID=82380 RepID=UPI00364007AF
MAFRYPLDNVRITQGWGADPQFYKQYGQNGHNGIDLAAPAGTPVYAAEAGTIVYEGWGGKHGWVGKEAGIHVLIRHAGAVSNYAHLSGTVVNAGQAVSKGQLIGHVGATGVAYGTHLHFEVFPLTPNFNNGFAGRIDPMPFISTVKTATADEIKRAYLDILERPADAGALTHYAKYPIDFVRSDLAASQERRALDARKAEAARLAAERAQAEAAQQAADAVKAAEAKKALEAAQKAEADRLAAEAELARIAEEERIARADAEARAKAQKELADKAAQAAKEKDMTTIAQTTKQVQELIDGVADSDIVKEIVGGISKRTKFIVYMIGDTLLGLALIAPQVIALLHTTDPVIQGALVAGILSTSGAYILTMFGIYKSGKK